MGGVAGFQVSGRGHLGATRLHSLAAHSLPSATASGAAALAAVAAVVLPHAVSAADLGEATFNARCAACHAGGGNIIGYARGKTLQANDLEKNGFSTADSIVQLVKQGKGTMPRYYSADGSPLPGGSLSDDEIQAVATFVLDRAAGGWGK
uniref:Cytochrome c-553 n=1 Tax=Rhizochromulina marina TaxID=1034831 RepID=A0A7S2WF81_9STRA